jgi:uncharacterized damage-inducible protein DinB
MQPLVDQLVEAWRVNNRINLFLIDRISDAGMACTLSKRGGRNVVRQFTHLHNVRVWHLQGRARDLATGLYVFKTGEQPTRKKLKDHLNASSKQIETFIVECTAGVPRRRPPKRGIGVMVGYFISHESHHRGSILLTLKTCGHRVDQASSYAIWEWDRM